MNLRKNEIQTEMKWSSAVRLISSRLFTRKLVDVKIATGRSSGLFYAECLPIPVYPVQWRGYTAFVNNKLVIVSPAIRKCHLTIDHSLFTKELTATGIAPDLHRFPFSSRYIGNQLRGKNRGSGPSSHIIFSAGVRKGNSGRC